MGTNYLAPTWRQPENTNKDKLSNYSLYFDGAGHEINCGTGDDVNITGPISISVWFNADVTTGAAGIVCKNDAAAQQTYAQYFFDLLSNEIRWRAGKTTVSYAINTGQWYHAVGVYDGSDITLYIDGASVATASALADSYASAQPMYIGRRLNQSYFEGEIGQVCIFDYAIDQDQVTYLYNLNNPMAITGAEPVAYWPLGDNANPTATAGYPNISAGADNVFNFNGTDDWINCGEIPPLFKTYPEGTAQTSPWSASAWVKGNPSGSAGFLEIPYEDLTAAQSRSFGFVYHGSSNYLYFGGKFAGIKIKESGTTAYNTSGWNHIVLTFDGVDYTAISSYTLYVGGVSVGIALITPNIGDFRTANISIGVAGSYAGNTYYWDGDISNVAFFDTALSQAQIDTAYNGGVPGDISSLNPIAWYKLDQSANWEADSALNWQIPDAVSAYPQAMEVTGSASGGKISFDSFFSDGTTALNGFDFPNPTGFNIAGDKYAICTISWWQKLNFDPTISATYAGIFDFASQYNTLQLNYSNPSKSLMYLTQFNTSRSWQVAGAGATVDISDQKWHHYCLLIIMK